MNANKAEGLVIVVVMVGFGVYRDDAAGFGDGAVHVFELDGGVADVEFVQQHVIDVVQNAVAGRRWHVVNQHVAA